MGKTVSIGTTTLAICALEKEKDACFREAAAIAERQQALLKSVRKAMEATVKEHHAVLSRIIALEEAQAKLLNPLW